MNSGKTVSGQRYTWKLLEKFGEGDAGEVYLVQSFLEGSLAILKRPVSNAYFSDIFRQANQISNEANILQALNALPLPKLGAQLHIPHLLDQSQQEEGYSDKFFIIIERASGYDLSFLRQVTRFGRADGMSAPASIREDFFLSSLSKQDTIPQPLLVRVLLGTITLLETIHTCDIKQDGKARFGVIWNDIKPEHLYWDPQKARLTFIDWGNSQFLEQDGATKDRRYSRNDDHYQFIQELGNFIRETDPNLYTLLDWNQDVAPSTPSSTAMMAIKERLLQLYEVERPQLEQLRLKEANLYGSTRPQLKALAQTQELARQITAHGELPDFSAALNFHTALALQMASEGNLEGLREICERTAGLATIPSPKWELLADIAAIAQTYQGSSGADVQTRFSTALAAGITDDFPALIWELAQIAWQETTPPEWWDKVSGAIRRIYLQLAQDSITPHTGISRLFYIIQSAVLQRVDDPANAKEIETYQRLLNDFQDEVVRKWVDPDPSPPDSGIDYREVDRILTDIEAIVPGIHENISRLLDQPKAQAEIVLSAWERKEFETARRALRSLFMWDPDRRRLFLADLAIQEAPRWLARVHEGATGEEPFYDYITSVELEGRRLRNQVGSASWLDAILDVLKRLRKQAKHADLLIEHPEILNEMPWLSEHRSREILSLPRTRLLTLERDLSTSFVAGTIRGMEEGRLGPDQSLLLTDPLDIWIPEARGSAARVFSGYLRNRGNKLYPAAIKIIRPDRVDYALPLFREEVQILTLLRDIPGVTSLIECGFLRLEEGFSIPSDEGNSSASDLRGLVMRYGVDEAQNYLASLDRFLADGWLPYLALEKREQNQNLMVYCDAGYTHGWFLPLWEGLLLGAQICDILQSAHERNIVYRDHKLVHYYWDAQAHGVAMIDWNIAKRHPQGLSDAERQFDLVQFSARGLHHILTGRPAPGALPLGPNRPEEIEQSASNYAVLWTYDDERLPNRVKEILEKALNQGYSYAKDLKSDLVELLEQIPASG